MIWVCSDWHFSHDKEFIWKARGFNSITEMNEEIIKRHNSIVSEEDDVYVLGDLCMSSNLAENKHYINRLNGHLHIIYGNHCTENRKAMYELCNNVVEVCGYATVLRYKKYSFFLSHYPTCVGNYDDDERGLKGRMLNICGHLHTTNKFENFNEGQLSYHVEMDAHDCYPTSIEEIILDFKHYFKECDCNGKCTECKCK